MTCQPIIAANATPNGTVPEKASSAVAAKAAETTDAQEAMKVPIISPFLPGAITSDPCPVVLNSARLIVVKADKAPGIIEKKLEVRNT